MTRLSRASGHHRPARPELGWLLVGLGACVLVFVFISLAGEVMEGDTQAFDVQILQSLRDAHDPSKPIGPDWMEFALLDLTALGSPTVLGLVVCTVAGFLLFQARYRTMLVVVITSMTGAAIGVTMKNLFMRPRPSIVPHIREVVSSSFPSGHAMDSAIIYLTLGAMLMQAAERRLTKAYCLTVAFGLTGLVGISRVFLGVHYPTDVLGGWIFGFAWASICWLIAQRFEISTGVVEERKKAK